MQKKQNKDDKILGIEFPPEGSPRIRNVVLRSNARVTGKYPSQKNGRMMQWESQLEKDAFLLYEFDSTVDFYTEQPAKIFYSLNGQRHFHIPDIFVKINKRRPYFVEVKTDKEALEPEVAERTKFMKTQLPIYGYGYCLLTESEIRKSPKLENIEYVLINAVRDVELKDWEVIRRKLEICGNFNWEELKQGIDSTICINKTNKLIIDGYLYINVNDVWNSKTVVSFNSDYHTHEGV